MQPALPVIQGTVVQGTVVQGTVAAPYGQPVQPYGAQPGCGVQQPMAVVQVPMQQQPIAVAQVPMQPVGAAPAAPTNSSMNRGPTQPKFAATLASHSGQAVVPKGKICCPCAVCLHPCIIFPCCVTELGLGPASQAQSLTWDQNQGYLYLADSCGQHLNISYGKLEVNTAVTGFCCGGCPADKPNAFSYNAADGTIFVRDAPQLVLGASPKNGKLVLVSADAASRLKFL
eukprot:Transcript_21614.p1 GENE.Transcript_21614~~Transcript_21614.p1  ORF type:complete len:256 (+),score=26.89 Transcript_21614:82-768(+)